MSVATVAAGCFWGVETAFRATDGVTSVTVGFTGGRTDNPTYDAVCSGGTGHAEAVRVEYDVARLTYDDLLDVFFSIHDPTQRDGQGPDSGSQYRSAIFVHSDEQEAAARAAIKMEGLKGSHDGDIVTEIVPAGPFWPAEEEHQRYEEKHQHR